ncbi:hypothetical protein [Xenorhabdus szentirmaii]|nr:hypothetical protein [Xenorhabdus szentirmaii]
MLLTAGKMGGYGLYENLSFFLIQNDVSKNGIHALVVLIQA